jgi:hypothetical protein
MVMDGITKDGIRTLLKSGVITVTFSKGDGTVRVMKCTLQEEFLPAQDSEYLNKNYDPDVCAAWDLENNGWRSFKWDSLSRIEVNHE